MGERRRVRLALIILAIFVVALAARGAPLYWSPLPATTDGFRYVRLAERLLETGTLPVTVIDADEFVFTIGLAVTSAITGLPPLQAAQIFASVAGAVAPVVGAVIAHRIASERGWSGRRTLLATGLAGFGLALDGLFLRRTGVPDEEVLGLLLVPLLALAAHRWLNTNHRGWGLSTLLLLLVLPPLHNLSSLVGVLSVSAVVVMYATRSRNKRELARAAGTATLTWGAFVGYFELAGRIGLRLTFSELLRPYLGLFIAWVVLLLVGVVWIRQTSSGLRRAAVIGPIGAFFALVGLNTFTPLFPGTVPSPPLVVALVLGLLVPVAAAGVGLSSVHRVTDSVVLATLVAPVALIYYTLSASLTPVFFDTAIRTQTFAHLPLFVFASIGVVSLLGVRSTGRSTRRILGGAIVIVFAVAILVTLPLGYLNLDTGSYPSTTLQSEFEATGFASEHVDGTFTTEHSLAQVTLLYHTPLKQNRVTRQESRVTIGPTRAWVTGGPPPGCPVLAQQSWTTTGAHLYPTGPGVLPSTRYERALTRRSLVYTSGGHNPLVLSLPRGTRTEDGSWTC